MSVVTDVSAGAVPEGFREEIRDWLIANCPAEMRTQMSEADLVWGGKRPTYPSPEGKVWLERMAARGYNAPTWPTRFGGAELASAAARILEEEMTALNCRPALKSFGLTMLAPVLMEFGSEEQKLRFLPQIARGETRWCQGFSEPGAGSDLASLATRAVRDGDSIILNGHKVWTSYADRSDWMYCLVRTDPSLPKHKGISLILVDLASPGIRTEPIRLISGASIFCETFLEDVRVPVENVVGELGQGWQIAKRLLEFERASIAKGFAEGSNPTAGLEAAARARGPAALPQYLRERVARCAVNDRAMGLTQLRFAQEGTGLSAQQASVMKYLRGQFNQDRWEAQILLGGPQTLVAAPDGSGYCDEARNWLRSRGNTIEGGTNEIQLNIIAKRVLGLP